MGLLQAISRWESKAAVKAASNEELIVLEAKRLRRLFEALKDEGFTEDQAVQIVAGVCAQR